MGLPRVENGAYDFTPKVRAELNATVCELMAEMQVRLEATVALRFSCSNWYRGS